MKLYVNVKQAGSRRNYITKEELNLCATPETLRELISYIIEANVKDFNEKVKGHKVLDYLTKEEVNTKVAEGKVSFGEIHNSTEVSLNKALETAFLAYEDGTFRVFIGDKEAGKLDERLEMQQGDVLTFIRLTMLAGRLW